MLQWAILNSTYLASGNRQSSLLSCKKTSLLKVKFIGKYSALLEIIHNHDLIEN